MAQIDLTPATFSSGLHFHAPAGQSASVVDNPSDAPAPPKGGTAVTTKVIGTDKVAVRFSNPS
jgi:hypothetical protein